AANQRADHDTISEFRRKNGALIKQVFVELLRLSRELGLIKLGQTPTDGTKIAPDTTKRSTLTYRQLQEELAQVQGQVETLLQQAQAADQQEQSSDLPQELLDAQQRREKLRAAKAKLQE